MFKIKDGYRRKLQTTETMKLFGSAKKLIGKPKSEENAPKSWGSWSSFNPM